MICSFPTNYDFYKYISNKIHNLVPYSFAKGEENSSFLTPHFNLIVRNRIDDSKTMNTNEISVDPFDYHVSNCEKHLCKNLRRYQIHSNYD